MFEYMPPLKKKIYTALIVLPIFIALSWLIYIKVSQSVFGDGKGTFFSPVDNAGLVVIIVIFLFVYIFFVGMLFFDNIKNFIATKLRR